MDIKAVDRGGKIMCMRKSTREKLRRLGYVKLADDQSTYNNKRNYPYGSLIPVIRPHVLIPEDMKKPYRDKDGKMVRWAKVLVAPLIEEAQNG